VTCAGIAVAIAFAVLAAAAASPASVRITGDVPGTGAERSYDLIVRGPAQAGSGGREGWVTSPASMPAYSGGITLAQYDAIRRLPGVAVAAPATMVGYLPLTVGVPIDIPGSAIGSAPRPVTLTVRLRSDNGLSTVTWDDVTMAHPGRLPGMRSVRLSWTFLLPLIAVDPAAEARLLRLDAAVVSGSYLPTTTAAHSCPVPMLVAGSIADDEEADVSVDTPAGQAVLGAPALTAATAYARLVGDAMESAATVRTYWTASPVTYRQAPDGGFVPQPVAVNLAAVWGGPYLWGGAPGDAAVLDVAFRSLTQHAVLAAGATVRAVGVFDPARIASAPATPSPYLPTMATGADVRSRQLLGGRTLAPDGAPGGYLDPAASLVIPLTDIGAFTGGYADADHAAPIGVIRVRVAAPAGGGAATLERIRAVADEIVHATGLRVDAVLAATATTRVIDLPAGLHGRPPLRVDETWYRSGTSTIVAVGVDRQSIVLSELVLLAAEVLIGKCIWELLRARRADLTTLRALGWGRRQAGGQLLADFGLTALAAGLAAVLAVGAVGTVLVGRPAWAWLLGVPVAIAMIFAAACWPLLRATINGLARRGHDRPATPAPALLPVAVIALAGAALSLELADRWAFRGAVQSWAGRSISWQGTLVDIAAVLVIVTMATVTVADLDPASLRERAAEARTLRATGWSARDLARLRVRRAIRLGLAGGGIAGALVLLGGQVAAGTAPPPLIGVVGLAAAAGVAMSLLTVGLSTIFVRARDGANY
jgi:hypothetical protein